MVHDRPLDARPVNSRDARNIDPPAFARAARLCVEQLASACDALAG
jgi:hypothetical protein